MFNIDFYQRVVEDTWRKVNDLDGITMRFSLEQFYKSMQDKFERDRVVNILNSGYLSSATVGSMFSPGITNYFIINDIGNGPVCDKCGSAGCVLLILDDDYKENLDNKIFTPCVESYYISRVQPDEILKMFPPVPINTQTDYWYCPYCNEMHGFMCDRFGLIYDQKIIKVEINKNLKMPYENEREKMELLLGNLGHGFGIL